MDFKNDQMGNVNRQQRSSAQQQTPRPEGDRPTGMQATPPSRGRHKKAWIIGVAIAVIVIVAAVISPWVLQPASSDKALQTDKYQAVFLTNGQVYFGKLTSSRGDFLELKDVYYLQVQQDVQGATEEQSEEAKKDEQSQVSLAKLGSELHGPENAMQVNREQVLFWENLNDNSKVVSAIKQHTGQ
jgi:hypothetical protein